MPKIIKDNSLTIILMVMFLASLVGQWLSGWAVENEDLKRHGGETLSRLAYLTGPAFISSVFENWESEFLQMSMYVVLTAFLFQRGSSESNDPDKPPRDEHQTSGLKPGSPSPMHAGPTARWLYAHSLGLVLFLLFLASFALHWVNSAKAASAEALVHGEKAIGAIEYLGDPQLWFESFQNWQSEFLSTAVLVVLSIFLRQKNSPESKPVGAPHTQTGA
ncbi:MAG: DUF6766 family protein [Sphingomicrobium sp.]